jgi:hypothetical protein
VELSRKTTAGVCDISRIVIRLTGLLLLLSVPAFAQQHGGMQMPAQPDLARDLLMQQASGSSANPTAVPMEMEMTTWEKWNLMWHGTAFLNQVIENDGGSEKLFATNWIMGMADRPLAGGHLMLRSMFSLEPLTIGKKGYPELFQSGEGLINRQHPHDFFMELAAEFAVDVGNRTVGYVYAAPVGDPALGPVAFPHRSSAAEIPQAPLGHHLEDSTHIAASVFTIGAKQDEFGVAVSGFHGREPDSDNRWDIDKGSLDSWSIRGTWDPSPNWSGQISTGHLNDPEANEPGDIQRTTASVSYFKDDLSGSAIWGWNHKSNSDTNAFLAETTYRFNVSNYVTGRVEILKKEEFPNTIKALTGGYTKDLYRSRDLLGGVGGNVTVYQSHDHRPLSFYAFVRLRSAGGK